MSFPASNLLWPLALLVTLPLLIHWLSRRFPKKFHFSSIREIKATLAGRSRIFRWRHILMLILRTAALAVLLLAFLKPLLSSGEKPSPGGKKIILIVDHSLSMAYAENGVSALSRSRAEVKRLLDSLQAGDEFNLILADHAPQAAFQKFTTHKSAALDFLDRAPPPATAANFQTANLLAARLAQGSKNPPDIYYLSDFQRRDWADVRFDQLPAESRLFFINATENPVRPNRALTELTLTPGALIAGSSAEVKVRAANFSPQPWTGKIQAGFGPANLRETEITLPPWAEGGTLLTVPIPRGGLLPLTASLPNDDLPADNHRHLAVEVKDREEVVLLTAPEENSDTPSPSLFLATAINPFTGEKGVFRPNHLIPETLTPASLASSTRLIASRLPKLSSGQAGTLVSFLKGGGGAILFLDGENDPQNLAEISKHANLELPLRPTEKLSTENLPDGAMKVARGDFRSRFLKLFAGVRRQNLALLEFYDLYHAAPTGNGRVLLTYADGTPALTESTVGLGTLLICNFSVAELSSNLARQRLFPAWIHEMLTHLGPDGNRPDDSFLTGDTVVGETWANEAKGRELTGPGGNPVPARADLLGDRARLAFTAPVPGFYQMDGPDSRPLLLFGVNTDPGQSDLRAIDPAILPQRAGPAHPGATYLGSTTDYAALLRDRSVFHWFVLAALALFLTESLLFKPKAAR